ncbi:tRNA (adenosine(37)-N6)-threonylcarbamoyltransferase complex ATPase subunit type 1 TsaE [Maribacter sp. Asnod1-A12]|uniref:tRNA (adenosine(37)-N6)-threonylcarbamoyltransferase complex ATPase subunit type 1 TsaE n=1 Tax=Maribacter sp. Asnod1-A12 TaxID=3160576 RepID=UPI00386AE2D0
MEFIYNEGELKKIAQSIIKHTKSKTIAFYAPMGAGKTTLIKTLVKELGSIDNVSSPTFGLVNEYAMKSGELLGYHFDFYRLENEEEAMDMGLDDYLLSGRWLFMEWPEKISSLLPVDAQKINIEIIDITTRRLTLS